MDNWEIKLRQFMNDLPICGWSSDKDKLIDFLKNECNISSKDEISYSRLPSEIKYLLQELSRLAEYRLSRPIRKKVNNILNKDNG